MRLVIFSGILLAAAVWLVVGKSQTPVGGDLGGVMGVVSSDRERTVTSRGNRSGWGGSRRSELNRLRSELLGFSEEELIQMVSAETPAADQEGARRLYVMWERLGELKSEDGLDVLLTLERHDSPNWMWIDEPNQSHGAHAFVGGWAASLDSLEAIEEELFPQLRRFKEAGIFEHEYALGREMARFGSLEAWKILSAPEIADSPLSGQNFALSGLIMAMAGDPEISKLVPLLQHRVDIGIDGRQLGILALSGVSPVEDSFFNVDASVVRTIPVIDAAVGPDLENVAMIGSSFVNSDTHGLVSLSFIPPVLGPHLFSQALGGLMLSDPEAAVRYLQEEDHHPFEVQVARPGEVWETMASLDSNAAMALLQEPGFEEFQQGIAEGLVATNPDRVETMMETFSTPEEQERLLGAAIRARHEMGSHGFDPLDPDIFRDTDAELVTGAIERAIDQSVLNESQRESLRSQLVTSQFSLIIR